MTERPNLLILMTDQQRLDSVGAYGARYGATPNLDRLADEGIVFENHYSSCPLCVPARCSIATGRHPHSNGAWINAFDPDSDKSRGTLPPSETTLFEHLDKAGYWQAHVGVDHIRTDPGLLQRVPFEHFVTREDHKAYLETQGIEDYDRAPHQAAVSEETHDGVFDCRFSAPWPGVTPYGREHFQDVFFARAAVAALRDAPTDRPWALHCAFWAPHPPFVLPEPYASAHDPADIELPPNVGVPLHNPRHLEHLPGAVAAQQTDRAAWRRTWAAYLGLVKLVDECLGEVLDALAARPDSDRTLTLFTVDHGEQLGAQSLFQKMVVYQESVHVPLIVRPPGGTTGRRTQLTSHIDLLPTLLDYAGLETPAGVQGASTRPLIEEPTTPSRDIVYTEYNGNVAVTVPQRAVIGRRFKLIVTESSPDELYDLESDPYELHDLAENPEYTENLARLRRQLADWSRRTCDTVLPIMPQSPRRPAAPPAQR